MATIQTGMFCLLGTAGMAGIFCCIIMGGEKIFWQITKMVVLGTVISVIASVMLYPILVAVAIALMLRLTTAILGDTWQTGMRIAGFFSKTYRKMTRERRRKIYWDKIRGNRYAISEEYRKNRPVFHEDEIICSIDMEPSGQSRIRP